MIYQGEANGHLLRIYSSQNNGLDLVKEITLSGSVQDLTFSPDQKYLCSADSNRKVKDFSPSMPLNKFTALNFFSLLNHHFIKLLTKQMTLSGFLKLITEDSSS